MGMARFAIFTLLLMACPAESDGESCTRTDECPLGETCVDNRCTPNTDGGVDRDATFDAPEFDGGMECSEDCGTGTCIDGMCCEADSVCGSECCGGGDICSFNRCVTPGDTCTSEDDCAEGEYCESLLGDPTETCAGTPVANGRCLPRPPVCEAGMTPDPASPSCVATCSFTPPAAAFDVTQLYSWGAYDGSSAEPNPSDIRNSPIVIQMDDDDCDGRITGRDRAEIVVVASAFDSVEPRTGDLVVLSVVDGNLEEKWRVAGASHPWSYPAGGNIDGEPGNEIVVCTPSRGVAAYGVSGDSLTELWSVATPANCTVISLADLDQDGRVEVVAGGVALAGESGDVRFTLPDGLGFPVLMDVDGDAAGQLEIVTGRRLYRLEGDAYVQIADIGSDGGTYPLVADLDPGGVPEIVTVNNPNHTLTVWRYDADAGFEILRSGLDINGTLDPTLCPESSNGRTTGGGPPTASDVNADGVPDIAIAGGVGYAVFDGAKLVDATATDAETFFWVAQTVDCSSARTGSSVFDFNGDGRAEVLYADEHTFRIYEGQGDGSGGANVLFETCNTNGTILEMPIVADVDADGQADILVVANARYRACLDDPSQRVSGIRVFGNALGNWVRTRSVWNQHDYHITNVEEDGSVPRAELPNHTVEGLNNFRTNRQPGNQFAASDAVVTLEPDCGSDAVIATVRNLGESVLPRGASVTLYEGTLAAPGPVIGTQTTSLPLYPAQAQGLVFATSSEIAAGTSPVHAVVEPAAGTLECRSDNNSTEGLVRGCLL